VPHQLLRHVVIGQGIYHGAQVRVDGRDEDELTVPALLKGDLHDLGEEIDIPLWVDDNDAVTFADVLLDHVLHNTGLPHPGGSETPEMPLPG